MARTSLEDAQSLDDPQFAHDFDLLLPFIPGTPDTRNITIACQTSDIPGFGLEVAEALLHGVKIPFASNATYEQVLNATFLLENNWRLYHQLREWQQRTRSWERNSGSLSSEYKVTAQLAFYDAPGNLVKAIECKGFFLENLQQMQGDGTNGTTILSPSVTFRYTNTIDL